MIKTITFNSPLGKIIIGTTDTGLCLLDFIDSPKRGNKLKNLEIKSQNNEILELAKNQINEYFSSHRKTFDVPLDLIGTDFQTSVWQTLLKIPYGETISYKTEAQNLGNPKSYRAVANANGANKIAIIIPCHRVIATDGTLGGYGGGLERKKFLLDLEKNNQQ